MAAIKGYLATRAFGTYYNAVPSIAGLMARVTTSNSTKKLWSTTAVYATVPTFTSTRREGDRDHLFSGPFGPELSTSGYVAELWHIIIRGSSQVRGGCGVKSSPTNGYLVVKWTINTGKVDC